MQNKKTTSQNVNSLKSNASTAKNIFKNLDEHVKK